MSGVDATSCEQGEGDWVGGEKSAGEGALRVNGRTGIRFS